MENEFRPGQFEMQAIECVDEKADFSICLPTDFFQRVAEYKPTSGAFMLAVKENPTAKGPQEVHILFRFKKSDAPPLCMTVGPLDDQSRRSIVRHGRINLMEPKEFVKDQGRAMSVPQARVLAGVA